MKKSSVKVCVRTRPTQNFAQDNLYIETEHSTIQVNTSDPDEPASTLLNNKQSNFKFKFDHVFHNSSQEEVYDLYARDTVQGVVDGINGAVMTYGQTGSGKTFTMLGDAQSYENRGIAPRAINQLFSEINSRIEQEFKVTCTYSEIYNERIFDLLGDLANPDIAADYTIAEEKDGRGTFVRGLAEIEIKDENNALDLLFSGGLSRTIATHKLNKRSNRSHSIFTIYLQQRQRSGVSERVVHSKLHLVDLAGSERLKKTMDSLDGSIGDDVTRKESMAINQSLAYLEQCVVALAKRSNTYVPYRQSKLTNILKDTLGANCSTVMIACMWGERNHLEETISTLRLASRMMRVQNETVSVETIDPSVLITKQEKIIKALKQELLMHDALVERAGVSYDPYTPEQQQAISNMIERFVETPELDEESVLNISSYRQMLEICKQFKKKLTQARSDILNVKEEAMLNTREGNASRAGFGSTNNDIDFHADGKMEYDPNAPILGDTIGAKGFPLGVSTADAKPISGIDGVSSRFEHKTQFGSPKYQLDTLSPDAKSQYKGEPSPTKSLGDYTTEAQLSGGNIKDFEMYTRGAGLQQYKDFAEMKAQLKDYKQKCKSLAASVNDAKSKIDQLVLELEDRKRSRIELSKSRKPNSAIKYSANDEVVDEEEFKLAKELKEAKTTYKNSFEQVQRWKKLTLETNTKVEGLKTKLAEDFNLWKGEYLSPGKKRPNDSFSPTKGDNLLSDDQLDDQLDDQEAFDKLEMGRILADDPESLAFFNAQKTRKAKITQRGGSINQLLKNKRFT